MTDRTDRIKLPAQVTYCSSDTCRQREKCARRLAAIKPGSALQDFSTGTWGQPPMTYFMCSLFMSPSEAATLAQATPVARRVHEPMGGG